MPHMMKKILKALLVIIVALFILVLAVPIIDKTLGPTTGGLLVILGIIFFGIYFVRKLICGSRARHLMKDAGYTYEQVKSMSYAELEARARLYANNKEMDFVNMNYEEIKIQRESLRETALKQLNENLAARQQASPTNTGAAKSFTDAFYDTDGKRIVCINCGQRLQRGAFGGFTTSHICHKRGVKCVPYQAPDI